MPEAARNRYFFDNSEEGEAERLAGIQAAFDPGTFRHLTDLGVGEGWRCLEVGAGAGSVAKWLCERVGERGSVVATDIDTTLLQGFDLPNLEVRRHDLRTEDLPAGEFDLVHTRLVLIHLPERKEILRRMAGALKPGGWLLVEDISFDGASTTSRTGTVALKGLLTPFKAMFKVSGADPNFARRLPVLLNGLGLADVGAEGRVVVLLGGSDSVNWALPTVDKIQRRLTGEGATVTAAFERVPVLRQALNAQVTRLRRLLSDPDFAVFAPALIAAWGRRPG